MWWGRGDQPCASTIVQGFVEAPSALATLDTSCAAAVPPIRSIGSYPESLSAVTPLQAGAGNQAPTPGLQLGAAAVATAGDAVARKSAIGTVPDVGLHGGTVSLSQGGRLLHLHDVEFVPGVSVTGDRGGHGGQGRGRRDRHRPGRDVGGGHGPVGAHRARGARRRERDGGDAGADRDLPGALTGPGGQRPSRAKVPRWAR